MRIAILILTGIVIGLGWKVNEQGQTIVQLRGQLTETRAKLSDKSVRETFENQKECAAQAEKIFRQGGYRTGIDTNQSHFNTKFNKCFMNFGSTTDGVFVNILMDAFEQREYAEITEELKSNGTTMCLLTPLGGIARVCASRMEYSAFVAPYME